MGRPQYGNAHRTARRIALETMHDGAMCWRCHRPMYHWQRLDLDHVRPVALGGIGGETRLVHQRCNRSAGASLGNRLRKTKRRPHTHVLPKWLGNHADHSNRCAVLG